MEDVLGKILKTQPNISIPSVKVGCLFQLQKFKDDGTITYTGPKFHNMMIGSGLDLLVSHDIGEFDCCNLGTGAGPEDISDTGLTDYLTYTTNITESSASYNTGIGYDYPAHRFWRRKFEFSIGSIDSGISEIGLSLSPNSNYLNRHRIVSPEGLPTGLHVMPDEGIVVWTDIYLFSTMTAYEEFEGSFVFSGIDGNTTINYTWRQLAGWLTTPAFYPGRIVREDIRMLKTITSAYGSGTPAAGIIKNPYVSDTFYQHVNAEWDPGDLDGEYWGLLIQNADGTYGRMAFDTPIVMDKVYYPHTGLRLRFERAWGATLQEGRWI